MTRKLASGITSDPRVLGGKPVVERTRVPVAVVVGSLAAGDSIDDVCRSYRLTHAQVRAALAYAADSLENEMVVALPVG
jgi:uncharacterized protein (DUF433 family)